MIYQKPTLIIINGSPCTGKSFLCKNLSQKLNIPYISRDEYKEMLFDNLGIIDADWSKKLGGASYSIFFNVVEKLLQSQQSFITESNFNQRHREIIQSLIGKYNFRVVELFLATDASVLIERFKKRWDSGERHRGHAEDERFAEFELQFKTIPLGPLNLSEKVMKINTNDFNQIDFETVINYLKS